MNSLKKAYCSLGWAGIEGQYVSWEREGAARTTRRTVERRVDRCISSLRVGGLDESGEG